MNLDFKYLEDAHMGQVGDICFHDGHLVSIAEDSLLKVFSISKSGLELLQTIEIEEPRSVCSNQIDKIALGQAKGNVSTYSLIQGAKVTTETFENPHLAMSSGAKKASFSGNWLVGDSSQGEL